MNWICFSIKGENNMKYEKPKNDCTQTKDKSS